MKSIGGGGANKICLGLGGGFDGHRSPDLLEKFSDHVNALYYELWAEWEMVSIPL